MEIIDNYLPKDLVNMINDYDRNSNYDKVIAELEYLVLYELENENDYNKICTEPGRKVRRGCSGCNTFNEMKKKYHDCYNLHMECLFYSEEIYLGILQCITRKKNECKPCNLYLCTECKYCAQCNTSEELKSGKYRGEVCEVYCERCEKYRIVSNELYNNANRCRLCRFLVCNKCKYCDGCLTNRDCRCNKNKYVIL